MARALILAPLFLIFPGLLLIGSIIGVIKYCIFALKDDREL